MISYVTLGTNDLEKAKAFYTPLLGELGAKPLMESQKSVGYGKNFGEPMLVVTAPFDGNDATVGNGQMVALSCASSDQVDALHKKALDLGGSNEGDAGPRGDSFYCGYFRDPDGNKINAFCMTRG